MPRTRLDPPPGFDDLTAEEKVEYVQSLWDRILARPEEVPVPRWHQEIVAERLAAHRADPQAAQPAEEVFADLTRKLQDRQALLPERPRKSIKEYLLEMPPVSEDADFERLPDLLNPFSG